MLCSILCKDAHQSMHASQKWHLHGRLCSPLPKRFPHPTVSHLKALHGAPGAAPVGADLVVKVPASRHNSTQHSPPVHAALVVLVPTGQAAQHGAAHVFLQADGAPLAATAGTVPHPLRHCDDWDGRNGPLACTCSKQAVECQTGAKATECQTGAKGVGCFNSTAGLDQQCPNHWHLQSAAVAGLPEHGHAGGLRAQGQEAG